MFEEYSNGTHDGMTKRILKLIHQQPNALNTTFFSMNNVNIIQNLIKKEVYHRSNKKHVISRQSDEQLYIIMQSIFINNTYNIDSPDAVKAQIAHMNNLVADECAKIILPNLEQYLGYLDTLDKPVIPMSYGKATSTAGEKTTSLFRSI